MGLLTLSAKKAEDREKRKRMNPIYDYKECLFCVRVFDGLESSWWHLMAEHIRLEHPERADQIVQNFLIMLDVAVPRLFKEMRA